jgi:hypothetical protein
MVFTVNSDYFLKQHQPVGICNGEVWYGEVRTGLLNIIYTSSGFKGFTLFQESFRRRMSALHYRYVYSVRYKIKVSVA